MVNVYRANVMEKAMLIGIAPCVSPELLMLLARMGHGDELVLADAFFPGDICNSRVVRADGIRIP